MNESVESRTDATAGARRSVREAVWRHQRLIRFISARFTSMLGDSIWWVGIAWAAASTGNAAAAGTVFAIGGVPRLVLLLVGGSVADRFGPRRIMIMSDSVAVVVALAAALTAAIAGTHYWLLVTVALLFGISEAFYFPASSALLIEAAGSTPLPRAAAVLQTSGGLANAAGRAIGGVLVGVGGLALASVGNGISFAVSLVLLTCLRVESRSQAGSSGVARNAVAGLRAVWADPVLRGISLLALMLNSTLMPLTQVGLALRAEASGWGPSGFGAVASAIGIGMVIGSVVALSSGAPARPGRRLVAWLAVCVACIALTVSVRSLPFVCISIGAAFVCLGPINSLLSAIVLGRAPADFRGRVSAVLALIGGAGLPAASAAFGFVAAAIGLDYTQWGCIACMIATLVAIAFSRPIRELGG